jgi:hypothetical protein
LWGISELWRIFVTVTIVRTSLEHAALGRLRVWSADGCKAGAMPQRSFDVARFAVAGGQAVIEVVGDAEAHMLLLMGDVVAVCGDDSYGSVDLLAARAGPHVCGSAEIKSLVAWLADPILEPGATGTALHDALDRLHPLLSLLRPGRYVLSAHVPRRSILVVEHTAHWYEEDQTVVVPTDAWPPKDTETVRRYRTRIQRERARPAIVVLAPTPDSEIGYLLDGHHKLAAYQEAGAAPTLLRIAPQRPFPAGPDDITRAHQAFSIAVTRPSTAPDDYGTAPLRRLLAKMERSQPALPPHT